MWARAVVELLPLKVSQITVNAAFSCNAPSEFVMILLQIVAFVLNNNTVVGGTWGGEAKEMGTINGNMMGNYLREIPYRLL